ncbi:MAG: radical SAM protein [SAR324 cluster bacterium]|nr:radical SAM protein [SAR324 cluster bacterium]
MAKAPATRQAPPRDAANQELVWNGITSGVLSVFSSDHAAYRFDSPAGKKAGGENAPFHAIPNGLPGLERIRYTSPHPKDFNEPLARAHRDLPKLCEHLHLPFQAGSDRILRAMRRNHTIAEYLEKLAVARELVPGLALSTDIIAGFPGETEADFEATLDVIRNVRFDHLYAFKFSPRSITPAAELPGQVPEAVKAERLSRILALHQANAQAANEDMIGSRQEILVEGAHPRDPNSRMGRTRGHKSTKIPGCAAEPGALVTVEIVAARKFSLVGKVQGDG